MQIVCKSLFTKGVQMSTICTDTCLETLSALVNVAVSVMSCRKSEHTTINNNNNNNNNMKIYNAHM